MATNNPRRGVERKRSQLQTKILGEKHWLQYFEERLGNDAADDLD